MRVITWFTTEDAKLITEAFLQDQKNLKTYLKLKAQHMGTNYYLKQKDLSLDALKDAIAKSNDIEKINELVEEYLQNLKGLHIGKKSCGWRTSLYAHNFKYWKDEKSLIKWLKSGIIVDEYGREHTFEEFWQKVQPGQGDKIHSYSNYQQMGKFDVCFVEFC